jgi:hypothetical protein
MTIANIHFKVQTLDLAEVAAVGLVCVLILSASRLQFIHSEQRSVHSKSVSATQARPARSFTSPAVVGTSSKSITELPVSPIFL